MKAIASKNINFSCEQNVLLWTYIYIFTSQGRYFVIIFRKVFHCELSHFYYNNLAKIFQLQNSVSDIDGVM